MSMTDTNRAPASGPSWNYMIDPGVDPKGRVPGFAVVGAIPLDGSGEPSGEFARNPNYRPSPVAVMLDKVENDPVVNLCGAYARNEIGPEVFLAEFSKLGGTVISSESGGNLFIAEENGRRFLQVFTSAPFEPKETAGFELTRLSGAAIIEVAAGGIDVYVNPDPAGTFVLPASLFANAASS